ncbi:putative alpha-amylase protein [Phaeoacremonium minimum UCRPA7]|uniref:Putative alpha-amylase protein n=1 Tax=Phaeoacremonium minimum (strain UCR-PA7) TaxID=1286976 RepID=R8BCX7_PHAM7|nr:putative alpha-amylase protein [Phaeoacremonium minimum UCRPA7]EON97142.1 putative alpha-amylase protein [Phaeoacremonium minimum UCRPA7]
MDTIYMTYRLKTIAKPEKIEVWTGFDFKGRNGAYSQMKWNKDHFTGTDYDHRGKAKAVWQFEGKFWANDVDEELGNYDYLHPEVRRDIAIWVMWLASQLKLGGLRLDAIKHYSGGFLREMLQHIDRTIGPDWFIVGEYWREDSVVLAKYIEYMNHRISLFDVKLCSNFSRLSFQKDPDLRTVFEGTLASLKPQNTVSFVVNHDTTPVAPYFIPMAYSLILLRADTGLPCVFYGDLYGCIEPEVDGRTFSSLASGGVLVPKLMLARKLYAYGSQLDYFDQTNCIGFTRTGHPSRSGGAGLAVVLTSGWTFASKRIDVDIYDIKPRREGRRSMSSADEIRQSQSNATEPNATNP